MGQRGAGLSLGPVPILLLAVSERQREETRVSTQSLSL